VVETKPITLQDVKNWMMAHDMQPPKG
jgi:hypothetical protein